MDKPPLFTSSCRQREHYSVDDGGLLYREIQMGAVMECARKRIAKKRGFYCKICGYDGGPSKYLVLHHIIPRSQGGKTKDHNLVFLCESCHADVHGWNKKNWLDPYRKHWSYNG